MVAAVDERRDGRSRADDDGANVVRAEGGGAAAHLVVNGLLRLRLGRLVRGAAVPVA